jgi:hypothetical protein
MPVHTGKKPCQLSQQLRRSRAVLERFAAYSLLAHNMHAPAVEKSAVLIGAEYFRNGNSIAGKMTRTGNNGAKALPFSNDLEDQRPLTLNSEEKNLAVHAGMGRLQHKRPSRKAEPPDQPLVDIGAESVLKFFHGIHARMLEHFSFCCSQ